MGRPKDALIAYSSIVDLHPGDAAAHRRLGEIYGRRNRPEEAMAQFEAGLKLAPNDEDLRQRVVDHYRLELEQLRKEGKVEAARALRRRLGSMNAQEFGLFDIKVIMTWDAMSDVDLDVVEPDGTRINHNNRNSRIGGTYSADNTKGLGPELYTLHAAGPGTYRVGAHLHGGAKSTIKFEVILFEDTPREERRQETLTITLPGEGTQFIRDIVIP
jgi:tetratricopeptide (TPR) repeat protein